MDLDIYRLFTFELFYTLKRAIQISLPLVEMAVIFAKNSLTNKATVGGYIFRDHNDFSNHVSARRKKVNNQLVMERFLNFSALNLSLQGIAVFVGHQVRGQNRL